jgi:ABC-type lipoprotein export system ATPase subunit
VRKLTVKNFSVIKVAELEFGKITVLIGPQSSGKSLLCKLAYFLSKQAIDHALTAILSNDTFEEFKRTLLSEFTKRFPINTWQHADTNAVFESASYWAQITGTGGEDRFDLRIEFSDDFESLFSTLIDQVQNAPDSGADSRKYIVEQVEARLNLLLTETFVHRALYIPGGRSFFANQSLGFNALKNPDIDPLIRDFSLEVSWGDSWKPNPIVGEAALQIFDQIRREMNSIAGGYIEGRNASARFRRESDGRSIPLPLLSSGTQELLPLLNVLGQLAAGQRDRIIFPRPNNLPVMPREIILSKGLIYLEEPEANVFPDTQNKLVRLFAWLSHEPTLDFSWVITTHSPYILTAFNNLIEAGQAASNNPMLHDAVAEIIPERYWIKSGDFKAYAIEDGKLKSILNESGFIEGNYLDQVSEVIGNEFDELLRLEYDHTKAS